MCQVFLRPANITDQVEIIDDWPEKNFVSDSSMSNQHKAIYNMKKNLTPC